MDLTRFTAKHEAFDGSVVFHFFDFETSRSQRYVRELNRIEPEREFVHRKTGERRRDEPKGYAEYNKRAQKARESLIIKFNKETGDNKLSTDHIRQIREAAESELAKSEWSVEWLWSNTHEIFCIVFPATIEIEFSGELSSEVQLLQYFWNNRDKPIAEQWELFVSVVSKTVQNAWMAAYQATRRTTMKTDPLPHVEETSDPN